MWLRPKAILVLIAFALLFVFAHAPLVRAGLTAPDLAVLLDAGRPPIGAPSPALDVEGGERAGSTLDPSAAERSGPLGALSLALSRRLWATPDRTVPAPSAAFLRNSGRALRIEGLVLLLIAAFGLARFTRRLLLPWCGSEQARAAAWSAGCFFAVHPLTTPAIACLDARGEALGLALGLASAALFLAGRQDRHYALTVASVGLALLAGWATDLALGLPLLLAASEFVSSHRYRKKSVRLRTTLTTLIVFGSAVLVRVGWQALRGPENALPEVFTAWRAALSGGQGASLAVSWVEKLGLLLLPSNSPVLGVAGTVVAGVIFLLAVQPALVAARHAPRLWGWLLVSWVAVLAVSSLLHADLRVSAESFALSRFLLPSTAIMAVGLGLAATALSGPRRPYVAWMVALGFAGLAHAGARPWPRAAARAEALRADLFFARDALGPDTRVLVLDPPRAVGGVEPFGDAMAWLLHPALDGEEPLEDAALPWVRGISTPAFVALAREPEFDALRGSAPLALLVSSDAARSGSARAGAVAGDDDEVRPVATEVRAAGPSRATSLGGGEAPPVHIRRLGEPRPTVGPRYWTKDPVSPLLDLEALGEGALIVSAKADRGLDSLERVTWQAAQRSEEETLDGTWIVDGDRATGIFDFASTLRWRLGGRVQRIWFAGASREIERATLAADLPRLVASAGSVPLEPRVVGTHWYFDRPGPSHLFPGQAAQPQGEFAWTLLNLDTYEFAEFPVRCLGSPDAARGDPWHAGDLLVEDAERRFSEHAGTYAWTLEYRIDGRAVARTAGRRD